ncbi:MAG: phage gp6-like head-tail connector protein [Oscillospiraceae bacterium]|nr:phage gp6-like head-tail connector protein [Oscillospiraceae bacterium]
MLVSLDEIKNYLRVDFTDDDALLQNLLSTAQSLCVDILRIDDESCLQADANAKTAILYAVAYLYEHREEANYNALLISLRALLFGSRREMF